LSTKHVSTTRQTNYNLTSCASNNSYRFAVGFLEYNTIKIMKTNKEILHMMKYHSQ